MHLGKPINIFKNFEEELVEDGSEILIVEFKRREEPRPMGNEIKMAEGGETIKLSTTGGMEKGSLHETV